MESPRDVLDVAVRGEHAFLVRAAEEGDLDVLAVVLDRLEGADIVVVPGDQDGGIIVVLEAVNEEVGRKLDIDPFLIGRGIRPVVIDKVTEAELEAQDAALAAQSTSSPAAPSSRRRASRLPALSSTTRALSPPTRERSVRSSAGGSRRSNGTTNQKVEPQPGSLSTPMSPPIIAQSRFAIERPRPVPLPAAGPDNLPPP